MAVDTLRARQEEVVRTLTSRLLAVVPEYRTSRNLVDGPTTPLCQGTSEVVELSLGAIGALRRLREHERDQIRRGAIRWARQGVSRSAVNHALRVAVEAGRAETFASLTGQARGPMVTPALNAVAGAFVDLFEDLRDLVAEGYEAFDDGADSQRGRAVREIIAAAAAPDSATAACRLGVGMDRSVGVIAAYACSASGREPLDAWCDDVAGDLSGKTHGPAVFPSPRPHALVLSWEEGDIGAMAGRLAPGLEMHALAALVDVAPCFSAIPESTDLVQLLLERAPSVEPGSLVPVRSLLPDAVLGTGWGELARRYVRRVLRPLEQVGAAQASALVETLSALYSAPGGLTKQAARALGVSAKTVTNRKRRLREVGMDLAGDRFALELAVRTYEAHRDAFPPFGEEWWR